MIQPQFIAAHPNTWVKGRKNRRIRYIVLHTTDGYYQGSISTFQTGSRGASAHYIINLDGHRTQMVHDEDTAWHAGNEEINYQSIGIEHVDDKQPYGVRPLSIYESSAELIAHLCHKHGLFPDRLTLKLHKEVSIRGTACPGSLNENLIIELAQIQYEQMKNKDTIPAPAPEVPATPFTRNVTVIADRGLNVRSAPVTSATIVKIFQKNVKFAVDGVVVGQEISGNKKWYKLKGENVYAWAGATNIVDPTVSEVEKPAENVEPTVPPAPPAPEQGDDWPVKFAKLEEINKILRIENENLTREMEALKKKDDAREKIIANYETQTRNEEVLKSANKVLTDNIEAYKTKVAEQSQKLKNSYAEAFKDWVLIEVPHGVGALARLPLIATQLYGLIASAMKHDYVIGWKKDAKIRRVSDVIEDEIEL